MITLYNHTHTVAFTSEPSHVYSAGSLSKSTTRVLFYNDGQGVKIEDGNFSVTLTINVLNPDFVSAHSLSTDVDLFNLLVTWQNERTGNA